MKDYRYIWKKPIYLPYLQPELTAERIQEAEEILGYKLPVELIELLKVQNGGYIRMRLEQDSMNGLIYGIGPYFPSMLHVDWSEYKDCVSFELEGLIPFDGDGHWYLCLDYRNDQSIPEITYIDTETDYESSIATSFGDYLSQLKLFVEDEQVICTQKSIKEICQILENFLGAKFDEPNKFDHGFDQYKMQLKDGWIWLSANQVLKGFVRMDHPRYLDLIELSAEKALRFPELPEGNLIIRFSNQSIENRVLEMFKVKAIEIKPLEEMIG